MGMGHFHRLVMVVIDVRLGIKLGIMLIGFELQGWKYTGLCLLCILDSKRMAFCTQLWAVYKVLSANIVMGWCIHLGEEEALVQGERRWPFTR